VTRRSRALCRALAFGAAVWIGAARVEAANCSFSTTPVSFGAYNVFASAPTDTVGTIRYECNGGAKNVLVTITAGSSGRPGARSLVGGGDTLLYNLFRDPARTNVWGDGTGGAHAVIVADPPNRSEQTLTIYGRIPAGQDVRAGTYTDSITVIVQY
jgi:spore coat protein U-like protein